MQNGVKEQWPLILLILTIVVYSIEAIDSSPEFLDEISIKIKRGGREEAENIASDHGFVVTRELKHSGIYILENSDHHRSKRSTDSKLKTLLDDPRIDHAQQEEVLKRDKRSPVKVTDVQLSEREIGGKRYTDPEADKMWYIQNVGQNGGEMNMDMNIGVVWKNGFTGKGVVVTILDDGVDHRHEDLKQNYDPMASTDLNDKNDTDHDPLPNWHDDYNRHGTRCAGEVAATANNSICGMGIAYDCKIGGIRILDGKVTDSLEAEAILFNNQYIDIYSASWGPLDNGHSMDGPRKHGEDAIIKGVAEGRKGLGSVFVWAAGNGGNLGDDCGADGYLNRPETVSIGSVNTWGRSPFFIENCTSTMAVVPSGGDDLKSRQGGNYNRVRTITTDMNFGCVENFQGTSSSAPLAAGCFANVLQANPKLGWRDLQHILVHSTRIPSSDDSWIINGAGLHVSPRFGFGTIDCGKMVETAQGWTNVPERHECSYESQLNKTLPRNGTVTDSIVVDGCASNMSKAIDKLEHVLVHIHMETERRGETLIELTSPAGTTSKLIGPRVLDLHKGKWHFTFMTVHSWDEQPRGKWTITVKHVPFDHEKENSIKKNVPETPRNVIPRDKRSTHTANNVTETDFGKLISWDLILYGTAGDHKEGNQVETKEMSLAYKPSEEEILRIKKDEIKNSMSLKVKRAFE